MIRRSFLSAYMIIAAFTCFAQQYGSFKDPRDGRVYKTVKIGEQVWMAENLNADRFRNGDLIHQAKSEGEWIAANETKSPAWFFYKDDSTLRKFYNWYAVIDPRLISANGWNIPKNEDWHTLINYLGGRKIASSKMKSTSNSGWSPGNNSSGFDAMPNGAILCTGKSVGKYSVATWWSIKDNNNGLTPDGAEIGNDY